jgi:hypothetical protein
MRADNSHHVIAAACRRAEQTRERAIAELRRMDATGQRITFDAVSRAAGVSRSWLYAKQDLRAEIQRLSQRHQATPPPQVPPQRQRASETSLLRRLEAATARIRRLGNRQPATPRRPRPSARRTPSRRSARPQERPRHAEEELAENHRAVLSGSSCRPVKDTSTSHRRRSKP